MTTTSGPELERCAVDYFHNSKGFGIATIGGGTTIFLPASNAGVYEGGKIRPPYIGERILAPVRGDTVVCQTEPNPKKPGQLQATIWATLRTTGG